jgi:hypothetical protein
MVAQTNIRRRFLIVSGGAILNLFGPTLVPDAYEPFLASFGILLILGALFWPWIMRWQFGEPEPASSPIRFAAFGMRSRFQSGTLVNGIEWDEGYFYLQLRITNLSSRPLMELEVIIDVGDLWIAEAALVEPSSDASISAIGVPWPAAALTAEPGGTESLSLPTQLLKQWTGQYRLSCRSFGSRAEIIAVLAVVKPKPPREGLSSDKLYQPAPPGLEALLINSSFNYGGEHIPLDGELPVTIIDGQVGQQLEGSVPAPNQGHPVL